MSKESGISKVFVNVISWVKCIPTPVWFVAGAVVIVVVIGGLTYFVYTRYNKEDISTSHCATSAKYNPQNKQFKEKSVDDKVKCIHFDMITKLGAEYFTPGDNKLWIDFRAHMEKHLSIADLNDSDIKHISDVFRKLEAKGIITHGNYNEIVKDFDGIHVGAGDIIKQAAKDIDCIRQNKLTYAELEKVVRQLPTGTRPEYINNTEIQGIRRRSATAERQFEHAQRRQMADIPRRRENEEAVHNVETQEELQALRKEIRIQKETISKLIQRENEQIQRENEQNQRINDLEDGQKALAAKNKALTARISTLETERATREQDEEIRLGRAPNRSTMAVGSTEVFKGSKNIPDFKRMDK